MIKHEQLLQKLRGKSCVFVTQLYGCLLWCTRIWGFSGGGRGGLQQKLSSVHRKPPPDSTFNIKTKESTSFECSLFFFSFSQCDHFLNVWWWWWFQMLTSVCWTRTCVWMVCVRTHMALSCASVTLASASSCPLGPQAVQVRLTVQFTWSCYWS